jgi:hypothetical protein
MPKLPIPATAEPGMSLDKMKQFVRDHFEDFVNRKKPEVALTNLSDDFLDRDEPYGESVGNIIVSYYGDLRTAKLSSAGRLSLPQKNSRTDRTVSFSAAWMILIDPN